MMLLENKHAVIYEAGGPIGAAVAGGFAREVARVSSVPGHCTADARHGQDQVPLR